jgi:hypothetical protein
VGDSASRNIFYSIAKRLDPKSEISEDMKPHQDLQMALHTSGEPLPTDSSLFFRWDPYLNSTQWEELFNAEEKKQQPTLLAVSYGSWFMKNVAPPEDAYLAFKESLHAFAEMIESLPEQKQSVDVVLLPMTPVVSYLLSESRQPITNKEIGRYNQLLESMASLLHTSSSNSIRVLYQKSWYKVAQDTFPLTKDGLHYDQSVYQVGSEILLNIHCNRKVMNEKNPMIATCNTNYRPANWKQIGAFTLLAFYGPICLLLRGKYHRS